MDCYLLIDFGSTYTKLTLVDSINKDIVCSSSSRTTVEDNILIGYEKALTKLKTKVNFDNVVILNVLACSSAAGGLKMVSIGITPKFTVEVSKMACLSAGARLLKSYSYFLSEENMKELLSLNPDIILLMGGAEGGNTKYIIENAKMLARYKIEMPVVVAGNSAANENIVEIFDENEVNYIITENAMPDVNRIHLDSVREIIRKIFIKQIKIAKGMESVEKATRNILMPTPSAVLQSAKLMSEGTEKIAGFDDVLIVDIGGATTDIHTASEAIVDESNMAEGVEEPYLKRTVEGDLGMRYSALSLYENVGKEVFEDNFSDNPYEKLKYRYENPRFIPETEEEKNFDEFMAKICVSKSVERHCGKIRKTYLNGRIVNLQTGKDLSKIKYVIGTGGVLVNSSDPRSILEKAILKKEGLLSPKNPKFFIDQKYILSAMGILSLKEKELAFDILMKNLKEI